MEQIKAYDQREKDKKDEYNQKLQVEKKMRDRQVKEENKRKKIERRREDELDHLLVEKIKEEINLEEEEFRDRKNKEK